MIEAKVICDSVSPAGKRLTTFKLRYPKFIHGEFMTHRVVSRNASSSRAIPTAKLIEEVRSDALRAAPVFWGKNQAGMQAAEELDDVAPHFHKMMAQECWKRATFAAVRYAEDLVAEGAHKQIVNRLLEPFSHINVVATATEWDNFFGLRLDAGAQPEMRALAIAMWEARRASIPNPIQSGQWHLPFFNYEIALEGFTGEDLVSRMIKISVARCARVSYESFETGRRSTVEEDMKLYDRLAASGHWSPFEHAATPDDTVGPYDVLVHEPTEEDRRERKLKTIITCRWARPELHGNLSGWVQFRKTLPGEAVAPLPKEYAP